MASLKLIFCLTFLFLGKMAQEAGLKASTSAHKKRSFISANVGDTVSLQCFYGKDSAWLFWYKQTPGQMLDLISTFYLYDGTTSFLNEFKNDPRFHLHTDNGNLYLEIKHLRIADSGTYYCAHSHMYLLTFAEGTFVNVNGLGLNAQASVLQSGLRTIRLGGSVTLNCMVQNGTCDGEHSVYWFKDSRESHPGLIYTHGERNDTCEREPETQTHSCVYNLVLEGLNLSHVGTYYCAVTSCGRILFGNGTKLDVEDEANSLVYVLSGALAFTSIVMILLLVAIIKIKYCHCRDSNKKPTVPVATNPEGHQDADNLQYAAINVNLPGRSSRQGGHTETQCVYSRLNYKNQALILSK
ncbi:uncharacterized protein LOC115058792 [Echeneis naucrates]|uniref:Immunoglobulin kappa light chain-like n=1 Tax=Echeneis naucrates TaxID=173247 RepID=A0A665VIE0_ECHNA|nr:uncharacterized protein LOC115058792 [Echeneis naucrates]XP_029382168.1 uncharacterized protein LOC115058792 [Echeneis naucrates]XP_029382169.1 uncharacterized protein LOC115058792 [Echeneis naucrates]